MLQTINFLNFFFNTVESLLAEMAPYRSDPRVSLKSSLAEKSWGPHSRIILVMFCTCQRPRKILVWSDVSGGIWVVNVFCDFDPIIRYFN